MQKLYEPKTRHLPLRRPPYLRRPESKMVIFSYELMRFCATILFALCLAAALLVLGRVRGPV